MNRFPPKAFLDTLARSGLNLSVHLCGTIAKCAVRGDFLPAEKILGSLKDAIKRVQLNVSTYPDNPAAFASEIPGWIPELILQQRSASDCPLFVNAPVKDRLSVLLDASGGRGGGHTHRNQIRWNHCR